MTIKLDLIILVTVSGISKFCKIEFKWCDSTDFKSLDLPIKSKESVDLRVTSFKDLTKFMTVLRTPDFYIRKIIILKFKII